MNIGQAAKLSGISAKMIRYYEQTGLLPKAKRTDKGYRHYTQSDLESFRLIRRARHLGFSSEQIATLLVLWKDNQRASAHVKTMALTHLAELNKKINELQDMAKTLEHLALNCQGNDQPDCSIIAELVKPVSDKVENNPKFPRFTPPTPT
ncbi:Cu(I)-responsive transcriptional regulator [Providencia rettgeri]|uniref:Cu(I)-responsive transcriptional regulator n=1 Tax=Providencia rettgeri TaxID=587 RepID=UPI0034E079D4